MMAVNRHAVGQYIPGWTPASRVIAEAVRRCAEHLGELAIALPAGSVMVNSEQFQGPDGKLGLGSSAAAAAATVGAIFEYAGYGIEENRDALYVLADDAHRAAQGGLGSGADIAATVHGGFVRFERPQSLRDPNATFGPPLFEKLAPPDGLEILVFQAGMPVATPEMIDAVRGLSRRQKQLYGWMQDELGTAARQFAEAFTMRRTAGIIEAAGIAHDTLLALGNAAHVPIVPASVVAASAHARRLGGAAKISGAGGGDVGVAFFPGTDAMLEFVATCPAGIKVLDVQLDTQGIRRRRPAGSAQAGSDGIRP
jgi:phosphomevalonate kinase